MGGMQNLMHFLLPEEKSEFGEQDRRYHSKKLLAYLHRSVPDFDVIKPETINGEIALLACCMQRCDAACKEYAESLHPVDYHLKEISGLETERWHVVKHATVLMALIGESVAMPDRMFLVSVKGRRFIGKQANTRARSSRPISRRFTRKWYDLIELNLLEYKYIA